jgi:hypothetical protein
MDEDAIAAAINRLAAAVEDMGRAIDRLASDESAIYQLYHPLDRIGKKIGKLAGEEEARREPGRNRLGHDED